MSSIELQLKNSGVASAKTEGDSMEPMLKTGDTVIIVAPNFPLKKYDVPVYHRFEHLTMHRILKVKKNGYIIRGDNRKYLERDITDKEIIGVLSGFYRNGKFVDVTDENYLRYAKRVSKHYFAKYLMSRISSGFKRIFAKGKKNENK